MDKNYYNYYNYYNNYKNQYNYNHYQNNYDYNNNYNNNNNYNYNYNYNSYNNYNNISTIKKNYQITLVELNDIFQINNISINYWGKEAYYSYNALKNIICQNLSFCIKNNNEIIGFCLMTMINDLEYEIYLLAVKPEYVNMKFGQTILIFSIKNAYNKGINIFKLHVSKTNYPALHLYKKLGFKPIKIIQNYYKNLITNNEKDKDAYEMFLSYF